MAHPFNNANLSQKPEVPDATGSSSAAVPNAGRPSLQLGSLPGQNLQITPTPSPSSSGAAAPFPSAPVLSAHHSPPTSAASGRRPKPSKPRPGPLPGPISSIQTPHTPGPRVDALEQEFHRRPIGDFADVLVDSGNMIRVYTNELQSLALIGTF